MPAGVTSIEYRVVAGGGGGGGAFAGGGGAGGFRVGTGQSVTAGNDLAITVGAGGTNGVGYTSSGDPSGTTTTGGDGGDSIIGSPVSKTSTGGGGGGRGYPNPGQSGRDGGSGGGAGGGSPLTVGAGNTPSTDPSQGNNGGLGNYAGPYYGGGGGGGQTTGA